MSRIPKRKLVKPDLVTVPLPPFSDGPWTLEECYGCKTIFAGGKRVAYTDGIVPEEEDKANGLLLMQAPRMFTFIQDMADLGCQSGGMEDECFCMPCKARRIVELVLDVNGWHRCWPSKSDKFDIRFIKDGVAYRCDPDDEEITSEIKDWVVVCSVNKFHRIQKLK